jgi:hypothetical protein
MAQSGHHERQSHVRFTHAPNITEPDVGKLFIVAIILDMIYEVIVFRWIYPVQS